MQLSCEEFCLLVDDGGRRCHSLVEKPHFELIVLKHTEYSDHATVIRELLLVPLVIREVKPPLLISYHSFGQIW